MRKNDPAPGNQAENQADKDTMCACLFSYLGGEADEHHYQDSNGLEQLVLRVQHSLDRELL